MVVKRAALRLLNSVGYRLERADGLGFEHLPFIDADFQQVMQRVRGLTMVPWQALHMTYQAAKHVVRHAIPGDVVECGVWRGGCAILMAESMMLNGDTTRQIYLYDTFAGMPEPSQDDVSRFSGRPAIEKFRAQRKAEHTEWCYASLQEVERNTASSRYPRERFTLVKGMVEETIPSQAPPQISILRLDTDWYASTKHTLEHLFPRLSPGGVLIIDDYGAWTGATKALDEYLATNAIRSMPYMDPGTGRALLIK